MPCSRWRLLSAWSSLKLRVLGGYWVSPLCFTDRRSASTSTCYALPPVSRLSFVLGDFSFGCGFGLCLTILLAPWGCRRAYCDLTAAASLREFFLAFVPQLEALSESLTHSIPRSFLVVALSASAVGFADALWLCPERALRLFFALVDPVALSPLLRRVYADGFRHWCACRSC